MLKKLLSQNSELRPDGIFNWSLPAFAVKLTDGASFNKRLIDEKLAKAYDGGTKTAWTEAELNAIP